MVAGTNELVQVGEDDDITHDAIKLEDDGSAEGALLVRLRGIVRHGLDGQEVGGKAGAGVLDVRNLAFAIDAPLVRPGVTDEDLLSCIKSGLLYQGII